MTARWITADVFDGLDTLEDSSVDLIISSPPFLALRSYLPTDHPDKHKEIGSEATPAEFIDVLLRVTAELRRVLAPHGSICVELGDTYSGASGWESAGDDTWSAGEDRMAKSEWRSCPASKASGAGWPLSKSRTLIPQLYEIALAYGVNPLTGTPSPAGQWRIRNVVTWARPNPPVGALGDKWRPATSDLIVACVSPKRYWDDLATRKPHQVEPTGEPDFTQAKRASDSRPPGGDQRGYMMHHGSTHGAPLLDYWEIPPGGYKGSHYAVFPEELVVPCVKAMCPEKVCRTCGEPSRRIIDYERTTTGADTDYDTATGRTGGKARMKSSHGGTAVHIKREDAGWSCCGCCATSEWDDGPNGRFLNRENCADDHWRPGLVLDPFAGSGTTLSVATGHGHNAIGIDLDPRNADLARDRIGPFLFEETRML